MMQTREILRHAIVAAALLLIGRHYQFDDFTSVLFALSGVFLSLFAHTYSRYWRRVKVGRAGERIVEETLSELGIEAIHDVYLPGSDGSVQFDHIALFPNSIAVIETKTYNGRFEMDGENSWYRIGRYGRRYRSGNPLWQLSAAIRRLSVLMPGIRVWGFVVMAGEYVAVGGHPKNVLSVTSFRDYVTNHRRRHGDWTYSKDIIKAWECLKSLKSQHASLGKTHVMNARRKRGDRFYDFEEIWPLWLWGSLAVQSGVLCVLAEYGII